jgi:hypothetical protein
MILLLLLAASLHAQMVSSVKPLPEKIIIDTDIGDDVDDAFAVALALRSPDFWGHRSTGAAGGPFIGRSRPAGYSGGCRRANANY